MFLWCSQCQRYLDEIKPYNNYDLVFQLCQSCQEQGALDDPDALIRMRPLVAFHRKLREMAFKGTPADCAALLEDAVRTGARPIDVILGLVQPCLHEIGRAWERCEINAAVEHRFTMIVEGLLERLAPIYADRSASGEKPVEVLLTVADGNYHSLGIRMIDYLLRANGISSHAYYPGLPRAEIVWLVDKHRPRILGISLATLDQIQWVTDLASDLRDKLAPERRPRIALGGWIVRTEEFSPPSGDFLLFHQASEVLDFLQKPTSMQARAEIR